MVTSLRYDYPPVEPQRIELELPHGSCAINRHGNLLGQVLLHESRDDLYTPEANDENAW